MKIEQSLKIILNRALEGTGPSREDCLLLLNYPPESLGAALTRSIADVVSRQRFGNEAIILGQIGVAIDACPADCKFCSFGKSHTRFVPGKMTNEEILASVESFTTSGDLYALFLMTMHTFDFATLLNTIQAIREIHPQTPQIVVNIGDFDLSQAKDLLQAGVNGAYHVLRLREGIDTTLDPAERMKTIRTIREAGLDWYNCCEPIGPEHTGEEIVDQIFLGIEYGCFQHAAMRRVYLPGSPLACNGQITELRLAQVVAVVALASLACPETKNIAVHEPNLIGLTSGANVVYAESGANPRDTETDTSKNRGHDMSTCKTMLYEAGFDNLLVAPNQYRQLSQLIMELAPPIP